MFHTEVKLLIRNDACIFFLPHENKTTTDPDFLQQLMAVVAAWRSKAVLMESRSLAWLFLSFLQKRAGALSKVCRARTGKHGDRMLALRVPASRAAWNARSWDPVRQVGETSDYWGNILTSLA